MGNNRAGRKFVYSFTQLILVELFYVPGMELGPGDAGISCVWSLQLAGWGVWGVILKKSTFIMKALDSL